MFVIIIIDSLFFLFSPPCWWHLIQLLFILEYKGKISNKWILIYLPFYSKWHWKLNKHKSNFTCTYTILTNVVNLQYKQPCRVIQEWGTNCFVWILLYDAWRFRCKMHTQSFKSIWIYIKWRSPLPKRHMQVKCCFRPFVFNRNTKTLPF